ncbi:DUF4394 domain-containing protein [Parafrankia discariae]|uniref:DUF4394 domain-containing protein n=1 Tax=Parafrankia discariae TaxID=365528 RepID=UPI0003A951D1|nr:DUF4394 domain-containing protein [Parafrankia discariae]
MHRKQLRRNALSLSLVGAALLAGATVGLQSPAGATAPATPVPAPTGDPAPLLWFDKPNLTAIGLTTNGRLVRFQTSDSRSLTTLGPVTGLTADTALVGIDYRVQNGRLYGVGNAGGIYVLSTANAVATKVSQLTVPLVGTRFGVDFNPAANRLRVVSDVGENLRHNIDDPVGTPAAGVTVADTPLTFPPSQLFATGVSAVAYTNNDLDPSTATTLFDIDTDLDRVAVQSPANNGFLAPTGNLGPAVDPGAGFDIYSTISNGRSVGSSGYAALSVGGVHTLYSVELLSGRAQSLGRFPVNSQVFDLAFPLNQ